MHPAGGAAEIVLKPTIGAYIAFDDEGWAMALGPVLVEVRRGADEDEPANGSQRPPHEPDA